MRLREILVFLIFNIAVLFSQDVTVLDSLTNLPIEDVIVYSKNTSRITNKYGIANLDDFRNSEIILFSHLSYKSKSFIKKDLLDKRIIKLSAKTFVEKEIVVEDSSLAGEKSQFSKTIDLTSKEVQTFDNVGEILKLKSSLQLKDYGGYGATKTVSSRGMSSENTIVLFNNVKISDLRSGIFDFSKISSHSIDKIEIVKNGDPNTAHIAAGGIVKITSGNSNKNSLKFLSKLGSDGLKSFTGSINKANKNFSYGLKAEYGNSVNEYNFEFLGKKYKRKNAQFTKGFLSGDFSYKNRNFVIKIYSHYSHFKNGIPGFVVTNNVASSKATNETNSSLTILNLDYLLNDNFTFNSTVSYNNQLSIYDDPANEMFYQESRKESRMNNVTFLNRFNYKLFNYVFTVGYEYNYADINGMNVIEQLDKPIANFRYDNKFFGSISATFHNLMGLLKTSTLSAHFSYNIIDEKLGYEKHTEGRGFNFSFAARPEIIKNLIIKAHYFDSFRNPTLNERYFSSLFFPSELTAEKYNGYDAGFDYAFNFLGDARLSFSYFNIDGEDKIVWLPGRMGIHRPVNFGKVKTKGIEVELNKEIIKNFADINLIYNLTDARNKNYLGVGDNSYNKYLVYSPVHRLSTNINIQIKDFAISVFTHFESERFYSNDNTKRNRLKHFFVTDIAVSYNFKLFEKNNSVSVKIHNLLNEKYMIIQSYPMPLRNILFTYNLEI